MILEQMKPNFHNLNETEQHKFFEEYISKRTQDMAAVISRPKTKGKSKAKGKQVKLTSDQYALLQKLGLI